MRRSSKSVLMVAVLALSSLASVQPAFAGCGISVKWVNKDNIKAKVHLEDSKVKVRNGIYKKLGIEVISVPANGAKSKALTLDLGCNFDRRYKFYVTESGAGSKTIYKPSSTEFTRGTDLTVTINF